jgi:predicted ATPase/serine phosphatase RsbU (regulator of sigma subunit)
VHYHPQLDIPGYDVREEVAQGAASLILRSVRNDDHLPVIIKTPVPGETSLKEGIRLYHEYELLQVVGGKGVIRSYGMTRVRGVPALLLEDFGAESLMDHLSSHRLDLTAVLRIGIQVAAALGQIHGSRIVHKDINPSNLLLNPATGEVKVTDFGIASQIPGEMASAGPARLLEGTLPYMSPEQTGRTNRIIDHRADFYAFGVTLYHLLVGWLPFQQADPMELIHAHIARIPPAPAELNPGIPRTVSGIIMKLLAKNADDRYQSAHGLQVDLEECLRQWVTTGVITEFPLGSKDITERLHLPQRLYGRTAAVEVLQQSFERVCRERLGFLLVRGPAGIGKSVLVRELHEPVLRQRGFFVSGKFDQYSRDTPYAPFTRAFHELVEYLLTFGETELERLRGELHAALGSLAGVLTAVIPEAAMILGEQPPPEDLPAAESENRFKSTIVRFVRTVARRERPLVIFVDDMQWADSASLALLEVLLADEQTEGLMLIAALRTEDAAPAHPATLTIEELQRRGVPFDTIDLGPLQERDITLLLADALHCPPDEAVDLAALLAAKTEGNPFFMLEFLKSLHAEHLIAFNSETHTWTWNTEEIRKRGITDNVVTLMTGKIEKLSEVTGAGLSIAACIGNRFDLQTFARVSLRSPARAADDLWPAIQEGLILPVGDSYKFVRSLDAILSGGGYMVPVNFLGVSYRFTHDRVQQAAYLRVSADHRADLHHRIGLSMREAGPQGEQGQWLFEMAGQFALGKERITRDERPDVMRLQLQAAKRAKTSSAFGPALKYVLQATELMREEDWEREHSVCREVLLERGECEYLVGHFMEADAVFDASLERFSDPAERSRVYGLKIDLYSHTSELDRALDTGIRALAELGVRLRRTPSRVAVVGEMVKARFRLRNRKIEELINLPPMKAERPRLAINLLMRLFGIAYSESEEFSALVVSRMLNLTLQYGNADVSAYSYGIYGLLLRAGFGAYSSGYRLGELGVRLSEKFNHSLLRGRCNFVMATLHTHWVHHARMNMEYLDTAYRLASENGDLLYASYALSQRVMVLLVVGAPLPAVAESAASCLEFVRAIRHDDISHYFIVPRQLVHNLEGTTRSAGTFDEDGFDEEEYRRSLDSKSYTPPRMYYRFLKMQALCLRGLFDEAVACAEESEPLRHALIGQVAEWEFAFFHALALARSPSRGLSHSASRRLLGTLGKTLKRWAAVSPENLECRSLLVQAELARLAGHREVAMTLYDRAVASARANEFLHVESLALEYAGRFHFAAGREHIAGQYLSLAVKGFSRWGATGKARDLRQEFVGVLPLPSESSALRKSGETHPTVTDTSVLSLDLLSVLKASQALSSEIELPRLLERMLAIVLENAGATRGLLVAVREGALRVEAERDVRSNSTRVGLSEPIDHSSLLCEAIVRYVARSKQNVVVHDALQDVKYGSDPYVVAHRPRAILSVPVLHQGNLAGILYLENNLTAGAFTPDRVEILTLLSSQIAVSMENARLHEQGRELARMQEEFRLAAKIQQELLPQHAPTVRGYSLRGLNIPAQAVGGDYFDFIRIDDHHLAVCIGDVSGKGLPASLLMANLQATLRGQTLLHTSPAACLKRANRLLHESTNPEKFATLFYGILDTSLHRLDYCNAGHEFPLLVHPNGEYVQLDKGGIGLGMLEEFDYEEASLDVSPGDLLLLYTDGVTEAMNHREELFGKERLLPLALQTRGGSAAEALEAVVAAVRAHSGDAPQSDDITLVAVRRQ